MTAGHHQSTATLALNKIIIGDRFRKNLGDLDDLAASIADVGLLHPPVVTPEGKLIAGHRRIEAVKLLGWKDTPVRILKVEDLIAAERDENFVRKAFTPSEAVAIGEAIETIERKAAAERQKASLAKPGQKVGAKGAGNLPAPSKGRVRDKAAAAVGMSPRTYQKAKTVVEATVAGGTPGDFEILTEMDRSGNVDGAYAKLRAERVREKEALKATKKAPTQPVAKPEKGLFKNIAPGDPVVVPGSMPSQEKKPGVTDCTPGGIFPVMVPACALWNMLFWLGRMLGVLRRERKPFAAEEIKWIEDYYSQLEEFYDEVQEEHKKAKAANSSNPAKPDPEPEKKIATLAGSGRGEEPSIPDTSENATAPAGKEVRK